MDGSVSTTRKGNDVRVLKGALSIGLNDQGNLLQIDKHADQVFAHAIRGETRKSGSPVVDRRHYRHVGRWVFFKCGDLRCFVPCHSRMLELDC